MSNIQEEQDNHEAESVESEVVENADFSGDSGSAEDAATAGGDQATEAGEQPVTEKVDLTPAAEVEKWRDVAARSQADLDNFRKRMAREKTEAIQYANRSLLDGLLPIIDNFDMGLRAAKDAEGDQSMIYQGMAMVFRQIEDFLTDNGVSFVESDGQVFDPNVHEAIKQESSDTVPEGNIIYAARRGYRLKDRILRAANVIVSSGPAKEEEA